MSKLELVLDGFEIMELPSQRLAPSAFINAARQLSPEDAAAIGEVEDMVRVYQAAQSGVSENRSYSRIAAYGAAAIGSFAWAFYELDEPLKAGIVAGIAGVSLIGAMYITRRNRGPKNQCREMKSAILEKQASPEYQKAAARTEALSILAPTSQP